MATFKQYWSVQQQNERAEPYSASEHFKKWGSLGVPMGKMYETALTTVEGSLDL
ncbi:glycosyl hydrolase family 11 [Bacillus sp. Ru63]|nr:glycosyl hydrolase family 11 [Bacillus sp. Ru63]